MTITARRNIAGEARQGGFTIIELLIATAVFSVILLVVTSAILQFSKQYYKGVIASSTQGVARGLIDDISQSIQFNGGTVTASSPSGSSRGWCIGSGKRYSYVLGKQVEDSNAAPHGLVSDSVTGCDGGTAAVNLSSLPVSLAGSGLNNPRELLGQHMRLSKFTITGDDPYTITIRVVYGDDDLLTDPTGTDATCKSIVGSQFCATSELSTTVTKRTE